MGSIPYPNAQAVFYEQYAMARRDEVVGILLALFLGSFGLHHFYLRRTGLGILYLCFFWTGIPAILGFFECFSMPAWSQPVPGYTPGSAQPFPAQPFPAQPATAQPNPNQPAITDVGTLNAC